jgi:acetyl esterase/lipase
MDLVKRIDPEVAAVLPGLPVLDLTDIPAARQALLERRAVASAGLEPSPTVARQDHFAPGLNGAPEVRVRHYRPAGQQDVLPGLYWIHGGGHVLGQIELDDLAMDHIVDAVGCAVVSVEWRRPPEHPFPAPMDDCYATGLTHRHAAELGVDPPASRSAAPARAAARLDDLAMDHIVDAVGCPSASSCSATRCSTTATSPRPARR